MNIEQLKSLVKWAPTQRKTYSRSGNFGPFLEISAGDETLLTVNYLQLHSQCNKYTRSEL